jgi:hypothetical protein
MARGVTIRDRGEGSVQIESSQLLLSCLIAFVTIMVVSPSLTTAIIKPRLYDGSINELGRYSMTFDAYEYIEKHSDYSIIAIGSSKMREAFDGQLLGQLDDSNHDFFNLATAGDRPYVRMLEISAILELNPEIIIIEIGPNTFSSLATPVPGSVHSRMAHLISLGSVDLDTFPNNVLNSTDEVMLPNSRSDQLKLLASYVPIAIEDTIEIELFSGEQPYPCSGSRANVRCVPLPNNSTYDEYLRYPTQFPNSLEVIKAGNSSRWTIEEFYGPALDAYINRSYHNPEGVLNKNQVAFEYMIEQFTEAGIEVVLVGLPYNPVLLNRLSIGQWNYYNTSIETYTDMPFVTVYDMMWDNDWEDFHFNDYTHMSKEGEVLFANKLIQRLSPLLEAK